MTAATPAGRDGRAAPGWPARDGVGPRWLRDGLAGAGPIAGAGLLANGGSLLVTIALARLLAARDYGALNQLIGVFFVVSTPGSAVLVAVVRRVAAWGEDVDGALVRWVRRLRRRGALVLVAFAVVVVAAGPALARLLGRGDPFGIEAAALAGGLWVLLCVDRAVLQAHRRYRALAGNLLVEGVLRTALMVAFAAAGLGPAGVAAGVLLAEAGTLAHARRRAGSALGVPIPRWRGADATGVRVRRVRLWRGHRRTGGLGASVPAGIAGRDLGAAAVSLGAIALLQYADVIVVARAAPHLAGPYAAVSVTTKALVFLALVVGGYLLPEAAISWHDGRHALRQLVVTLGVLAVPAALLVSVAVWGAHPVLRLVFSGRYVAAAGAFLPLAVAMVCLSAVVVVTTYLLAVGDRVVCALLVGGAVAVIVSVAAVGGRPHATAVADLVVQAALLALTCGELVAVHRRRATGWGRLRSSIGSVADATTGASRS